MKIKKLTDKELRRLGLISGMTSPVGWGIYIVFMIKTVIELFRVKND